MATNKKFRIQNGVDIHGGGLSIDDVTVIGADGKVVPSAIADAVAGLTSSDIADLQAQVSAILGTSPETLDTLQEIVAAFENADSSLTGSVAQNAADIATINTTLTNGVATPTDVADLQSQVTSNDADIAANAAAIAAANSRTSGISTSSGSSNIQMAAEVDMDSNKVTNMADPTAAQDAATKAYVDAASTGSSSSLATETAARIAGDSANEADATAKADAAEASAKAHADAGDASLQGQIDIIVGSSPSTLDTLQEIVTAFENADSTLTGAVAQNSTDIAAETARATAAEQANASSISTLDATIGDTALLPPAPPTFDGRLVVQSKSGPSDYPEAIHIYDPENPTTPISIANPAVDGEHAWDRFGESVAQNGSVLAVASPAEESDSGNSSLGVVWLYDTNDLSAAPTAVIPPKPNTGFGATGSIALSSTHLFVGAPWWYTPSTRQEYLDLGDWQARSLETTGAVLIYSLADLSADPVILHSDSPSSSGSSTGFGYSVTISDNKLIVGSVNDLVANGGSSTDDENTAPHGGGSSTIFDISGGVSSLTSSSYSHKLTAQSSAPGWKNFGKFSFVDGDDLWVSTGSPSYGSAGTTYNLPVGNTGGSVHKFSLSNPTSTPIVSFTSSDFSNGGSSGDYFGKNITFTDTHVVISAHGQENSGGSMSGFVYLYDKSSGNKSTLNFPPSHVTQSAEFGRSIKVVDDKLYVTRYVTYGQDTNTSNSTPNGNGEVWAYNANSLSSTPTALYEANVNSNEEFGLSLHTIGMPVASVGQLTVAQSINELESEIEALSSLQSGDTSSLTSAIATAKSEAISTASSDATSKADAAEASAKAHADTGDAIVQAAVDVVSGRVDAILNGSGESLDTIVEIVAAFEDADSDLQTLITSNATAVSTETARAQGVESGLQSSIDSLTSSTSGDVSGLQGQIDDEEAARISGDSSLQSQLNSEISRATSAEAVNAANIASEITARSNADAAIEADVVSLQNQVGTILGGAPGTLDTFVEIINAFEGADSDLQTVISSNSTRLTTAENNITALEADLTAEENARASGDSALQAQITANDTDIASNASAISAEETRATAAESGLQSQITSNDADIAALQTRAGTIEGKDADQDVAIAANASAIAAETLRAQTAESGISSDLAAEVSRAQGAEAALQSSIDFVKQNTDPAALDSLTEIVAAFQAADGSITSVVSSNTTRISALEGSVTGIEAWNTDNVSEGSTNLYFTEARAKACVGADANSCIDYDEASGKFSLDISETEGALVPDNATNADQLDGQHGEYYRINIYNVAGTLVN